MIEAPMCVCGDKWHEHNAANHAPTCPVLDAFAALTQRAEALLVVNGDLARDNETLEAECEAVREQRDYWAIAAHKLADARKVDDAMVERALVAWFDEPGCPEEINSWGKVQKDSVDGGAALRVFMREALDAALAVQP